MARRTASRVCVGLLAAALAAAGGPAAAQDPQPAADASAAPGDDAATIRPARRADNAPTRDLLIGLRGMGEAWQDPVIIHHYRANRFSGTAVVAVPLVDWLSLETELGYTRVPADTSRAQVAAGSLDMLPMSAVLTLRRELGRAEVFGGAGYGMVVFTETTRRGTTSGAKPGVDFRAGTRIHTQLVREQLRPTGASGLKGLDVEVVLGRRQHHAFGVGSGFDFSAWRLGLGMVARL